MINPAVISPLYTKFLNLAYPVAQWARVSGERGERQLRQLEQPDPIHARRLAGPCGLQHERERSSVRSLRYQQSGHHPSGGLGQRRQHRHGRSATGGPLLDTAEHNQLYGTDIYLEESHVLSPTFVNTARVGYARSVNGQQFDMIDNGTNYFTYFGLTGLNPASTVWGLPGLGIGGDYSGISGSPLGEHQNMYEYIDEINLLRGKHSIFFGAEIDVVDYNAYWYTGSPNGSLGSSGQYTYNGCNSTCPTGTTKNTAAAWQNPSTFLVTGTPSVTVNGTKFGLMPAANVLADWLLGDYSGTNATAGSPDWALPSAQHHALHPGRLARDAQAHPQPGHALRLLLACHSRRNGHAGILNPLTGQFSVETYNPNRFNFSPRVGFAYALNDKTAIHGGGGIYYYQFSYYDLTNMMNNPFYNTGLNATQTATNPVVWPTVDYRVEPQHTRLVKGAAGDPEPGGCGSTLGRDACADRRLCARQLNIYHKACRPATASNGTWPCSEPSAGTIC